MRALLGVSLCLCACGGTTIAATDDAGAPDSGSVTTGTDAASSTAPPRLAAGATCTATVRDECDTDLYCACASHTCVAVQAPGAPCYAADECSTLLCTFSPVAPFFDCAADAGPAGFCRED